jgi:hypothetical protein
MSDGRSFTDWRSSYTTTYDIAKRLNLPKTSGEFYSMALKNNHGAKAERGRAESKMITGDPWGRSYDPLPAKVILMPNAHNGILKMTQDIQGAHAVEIKSGSLSHNASKSLGDTTYSDCAVPVMSIDDPRWGLSPETLVLNMRNASAGGGHTTNWLEERV